MNIKTRRILYLSFILIYLTITPVILIYTAGYKIDFAKAKLIKTGTFVIDTEPRGAQIKINGKIEKSSWQGIFSGIRPPLLTPAKIKNLLPGEYSLEIDLANYWPWQKKLEILPGEATFAEHILLFKRSRPAFIFSDTVTSISLSSGKNMLAMSSANQLYLQNLTEDNLTKISLASSESTNMLRLSPNGEYVLAGSSIYNTFSLQKIYDLTKFGLGNLEDARWSSDNNLQLYGLHDRQLISFNLDDQTTTTLARDIDADQFLAKKNKIYLIEKVKNSTVLNQYSLAPWKNQKSLILSNSDNFEFINDENNLINLWDGRYFSLRLVDPETLLPIEQDFGEVKVTAWQNDNLLYANNFEVWLYNKTSNKKHLITRISQPIKQVLWHSNNNYFFYSSGQTINAVELDDREKRNVTQLAEIKALDNIYLAKAGSILYLTTLAANNQKDFYKLPLQ